MSNQSNMNDTSRVDAQRAKSLPPSTQYAIVQVLPNIVNGAFWSFTDLADIKEHIEALKADSKNITVRKLGNACLIEVNQAYLLKAVQIVNPNAITQKDVSVMQEAMASAVISFEKFLIQKGKDAKPFNGTVGIYCINNVTAITYKGVTYPAFRLPMSEVLKCLAKYGYEVQVNGVFLPAQKAWDSGQPLWDSTKLSPTKTGLFINIRSTLPAEKIKQLEVQFKAKYKVK